MERFAPLVLLLTCFNNILLPFHLSTSPCHFVTHKGHAVNDTGLAGLGEGGRYSGRVSGSGRGGGGSTGVVRPVDIATGWLLLLLLLLLLHETTPTTAAVQRRVVRG